MPHPLFGHRTGHNAEYINLGVSRTPATPPDEAILAKRQASPMQPPISAGKASRCCAAPSPRSSNQRFLSRGRPTTPAETGFETPGGGGQNGPSESVRVGLGPTPGPVPVGQRPISGRSSLLAGDEPPEECGRASRSDGPEVS